MIDAPMYSSIVTTASSFLSMSSRVSWIYKSNILGDSSAVRKHKVNNIVELKCNHGGGIA